MTETQAQPGPQAFPPVSAPDLEYVLSRTEPLWREMRHRRIFITGGTGFFGCWLLETFLAANRAFNLRAQAVVLTRSPGRFRSFSPHLANDPAIELLTGDVCDFVFPAGEFPFVIHAATESVPRQTANRPDRMLSTIVDGTRRCLEFAQSHKTTKFLLTSSGAVYGPQPPEITHIPEDYTGPSVLTGPNSAYTEGKRIAESLCTQAARTGLECKIARCFAFVGPHLPLNAHFAIGNFIRDAMRGGPIEIQGDGTPRRSYLYAADLAIWLWTMLFRAPLARPFNVGSDKDFSIREIAAEVAAVINPNIEIRVAKSAQPSAPIQRYVPSVQRAKNELGLSPGIALPDAIRRTADWHAGTRGNWIS